MRRSEPFGTTIGGFWTLPLVCCGYAWAERDALWLLADTCEALGEADRAVATRRDAEVLARELQLDPD